MYAMKDILHRERDALFQRASAIGSEAMLSQYFWCVSPFVGRQHCLRRQYPYGRKNYCFQGVSVLRNQQFE